MKHEIKEIWVCGDLQPGFREATSDIPVPFAWIGVGNPGYPGPYIKNSNMVAGIKLKFHDAATTILGPNVVHFNKTHAQYIIHLLKSIPNFKERKPELLLVNCMMGMSRSPAIAKAAAEILGIDKKNDIWYNPVVRNFKKTKPDMSLYTTIMNEYRWKLE